MDKVGFRGMGVFYSTTVMADRGKEIEVLRLGVEIHGKSNEDGMSVLGTLAKLYRICM